EAHEDTVETKGGNTEDSTPGVKRRGRPRKHYSNTPDSDADNEMQASSYNEAHEDTVETKGGNTEDSTPGVKRRGRPRKHYSNTPDSDADNNIQKLSKNEEDSAQEEVPLISSGKRRRLQNSKYVEKDSERDRMSAAGSPKRPQADRRKGRPQRSSTREKKVAR
ncbi:hypothetical protein ElyMa_000724600, partial [Elysia marginata]